MGAYEYSNTRNTCNFVIVNPTRWMNKIVVHIDNEAFLILAIALKNYNN